MTLSSRASSIENSGIIRMFELAKKVKDPLDLSLGMSDFDIPQEIKQAAINHIQSGSSGYSVNAGEPKIREALAEKLKKQNNIQAKPSEIIITSGATGGLTIALATLLDPGDEIIVFDPYFVLYEQIISFLGAKPTYISTYPNWDLPFNKIKASITDKTKAILINSPNNPTGRVYSKEELSQLAAIAKEHDLYIISDEVYENFVYQGEHISLASLYKKTITLMGPSKSAALAGWRIGYLHAPEEAITELLKLQQIFYVCASRPAQITLAKSLDYNYSPILEKYKEKNKLVKNILGDYPGLEGAFYAFLPNTKKDLLDHKIITTPGEVFSQQNTHFRISYSVNNDILTKALQIIKQELPK